MLDLEYEYFYEEDRMGMTITSGSVTIKKNGNNLIGISIGGGGPVCPCLYIVQIFDNTPASQDGTLQAGDELVSINGQSVKNKTKTDVAKMIQAVNNDVVINYNKLHVDVKQGKSLDIVLKKIKHRLVEHMSSSTADAFGLSRAILCNDALVKRLQELEGLELTYKGLVDQCKRTFQLHLEVGFALKALGDTFATIATKEPQFRASEVFRQFADQQRTVEKLGVEMVKKIKPTVNDLGTYLNKAIPDTRLTVKKYADAKFEYLAYCLKVKEMDDEEASFVALQEPLYRVESGNYEYRLILRCRQLARIKFGKLRADVLEKMELLENKHVQTLGAHLAKILRQMAQFYANCTKLYDGPALFPVEVDLASTAFEYKTIPAAVQAYHDDFDLGDGSRIEDATEVLATESKMVPKAADQTNDSCLISDLDLNLDQFETTYDDLDNVSLLANLCLKPEVQQQSIPSTSQLF